jgi:hypothetical protein
MVEQSNHVGHIPVDVIGLGATRAITLAMAAMIKEDAPVRL